MLKNFGLTEDIIYAIGDVLCRHIDNSNSSEPTEQGFCGTIMHKGKKVYAEIVFDSDALNFIIDLQQ